MPGSVPSSPHFSHGLATSPSRKYLFIHAYYVKTIDQINFYFFLLYTFFFAFFQTNQLRERVHPFFKWIFIPFSTPKKWWLRYLTRIEVDYECRRASSKPGKTQTATAKSSKKRATFFSTPPIVYFSPTLSIAPFIEAWIVFFSGGILTAFFFFYFSFLKNFTRK